MTQCNRPGCSAGIHFVRMAASGKAMPVDPHPDERGNIAAKKGSRGWIDGRYLAKGEELTDGEVRLMPHWSSCTDPNITGRPQKRARPKPRREPRPPLFPPETQAPPLFDVETPNDDPPAPF